MVYSERGADVAIALNQLHKDPVLKDDLRRRQVPPGAFVCHQSQGNQRTGLPRPGHPSPGDDQRIGFLLQEGMGRQLCPVRSRPWPAKLLDEIGLDKKDADGWRMRPDGKRLEFRWNTCRRKGPRSRRWSWWSSIWAKARLEIRSRRARTRLLDHPPQRQRSRLQRLACRPPVGARLLCLWLDPETRTRRRLGHHLGQTLAGLVHLRRQVGQ